MSSDNGRFWPRKNRHSEEILAQEKRETETGSKKREVKRESEGGKGRYRTEDRSWS
jgi:hypothetical protein